jgi:phage terminase large subunit GpA-like protein
VRHEALDARVYAYAALRALISMGLSLDNEADRIAALRNEQQQAAPAQQQERRWLGDRTKEWLKR